MSTNVVLAEDHVAARQALAILFGRDPEFRMVGQTGTLARARGLLGEDAALAVVITTFTRGRLAYEPEHADQPAVASDKGTNLCALLFEEVRVRASPPSVLD